jgi:hypothetical protein
VRVSRKHLRWYFEAAQIALSPEQSKKLLTQTNPDKTHKLISEHITMHYNSVVSVT